MFQIAITTEKLSDFIPKCEGLPTLPVYSNTSCLHIIILHMD